MHTEKRDLIPCDVSRFEGFFIVRVFNIPRRSPFQRGIKASVKENRRKKSSNLSSFHFFFFTLETFNLNTDVLSTK